MNTDRTDRGDGETTDVRESPEDILSGPPTDDDLGSVLSERPSRRGLATSTGALLAIVVLAVTFVGGLLIGRNTASSTETGTAIGALPTTFPSGAPGAVSGNGGNVTAGTVTRVDGNTVYVKTANGKTVKVLTDSGTQIQVTSEGTLADLSKGSNVFVQGSSTGGAVKATRITEGDLGTAFAGAPPQSSSSG